jgi:hypothetical protein
VHSVVDDTAPHDSAARPTSPLKADALRRFRAIPRDFPEPTAAQIRQV